MSLPEITAPPGTPAFLADPHGIDLTPAYADLRQGAGHSRKRRVCTSPPRTVPVGWKLVGQDVMAAVDDWFENALVVGKVEFAAQVKHQGMGARWWRAQWVEPYRAEPLPGGAIWYVTGRLLLTGEPSADAPVASSMAAEVGVSLTGSAAVSAGRFLAAEISVSLVEA
ncbi:MAG: hypothetical protein ABI605_10860 [Rhizobacter sp.]